MTTKTDQILILAHRVDSAAIQLATAATGYDQPLYIGHPAVEVRICPQGIAAARLRLKQIETALDALAELG